MRLMTWRALFISPDRIGLATRSLCLGHHEHDGARADMWGLMDSARHVIGCHLTQETRVQNEFDDLASTIHQPLPMCAAQEVTWWRPGRRVIENKHSTEIGA
jgi:hypothetical protein